MSWEGGMRLCLFLAVVALLPGCGQLLSNGSSQERSQLFHNTGTPVQGPEFWQWVDVNDQEFESWLRQFSGVGGKRLGQNDIVRQRAQFWVDQVDSMLRAKYPAELAPVPKPRAEVVVADVPNAFVTFGLVCHELPVQLSNQGGQSDDIDYVVLWSDGSLEGYSNDDIGKSCLKRDVDDSLVVASVNWFNENHAHCKIVAQYDSQHRISALVPNDECPRANNLKGKAAAKGIVFPSITPHIVFFTGLFTIFSEDQFAVIATHELGHYYRSHITASGDLYNYFFKLGDHNPGVRPERDAMLETEGQKARRASEGFAIYNRYARIPGQKIRSEFFELVRSVLPDVVKRQCGSLSESCDKSCKSLQAWLKDPEQARPLMSGFPLSRFDLAGLDVYMTYENRLSQCASETNVGDAASGAYVTTTEIRQGLPSRLVERLGEIPEVSNLADLFVALGAKMYRDEVQVRQELTKAAAENLGFYTYEQEADELSLEWTWTLGIDTKNAVETFLRFALWFDDYSASQNLPRERAPGEMNGAECRAMYESGWENVSGERMIVPIVDYGDIHHSDCYRAYNLAREVEAHHLVPSGTIPPSPSGSTWPAIKVYVEMLHDQQTQGNTPVLGPHIFRKFDF